MALTFANPRVINGAVWTFDTVADMLANGAIKVGDIANTVSYATDGDGGGATYEIVAASTGTADGGAYHDMTGITGQAKLVSVGPLSPKVFGAVGDGVTDDTDALLNWISYVTANYEEPAGTFTTGVARRIFDGRGHAYGVSSMLTFPSGGQRSMILQNASFIAVAGGDGFDNGTYDAYAGGYDDGYVGWLDPVIKVNSAFGAIENINVHCQGIANGIVSSSGRVGFSHVMVRRMVDVGIWHQSGPGFRTNIVQVQQFNGTNEDISDESVFTAIGILLENSDCKLDNTEIAWCLKNFVVTSGGITTISNSHFYGGSTPPRTNSTLVDYQGGGALTANNVYFDNGQVHLWQDRCTFTGCTFLLDNNDVSQTAMIYLHCNSSAQNGTIPQFAVQASHFSEYNATDDFIELVNESPYSWAAGAQDFVDFLNDRIAAGEVHSTELEMQKRRIIAVNNTDSDYVEAFYSPESRCMTAWRNADQTVASLAIGSSGDNLWARLASGATFVVGRLENTPNMTVNDDGVFVAVLPTYADNTAALAGGLTAGDMYKTSAGEVRITV